jgi:hypothetical protein
VSTTPLTRIIRFTPRIPPHQTLDRTVPARFGSLDNSAECAAPHSPSGKVALRSCRHQRNHEHSTGHIIHQNCRNWSAEMTMLRNVADLLPDRYVKQNCDLMHRHCRLDGLR